eukprot:2010616-Prymnesium_polylepis.1
MTTTPSSMRTSSASTTATRCFSPRWPSSSSRARCGTCASHAPRATAQQPRGRARERAAAPV